MADEQKAADTPRVSSTDYRKLLEASAAYHHLKTLYGVEVQMRGDELTAELYGRDAVRLGRVLIDVLTTAQAGYELARDPQFHPLNIALKRRGR
jgi:hypothetical protein